MFICFDSSFHRHLSNALWNERPKMLVNVKHDVYVFIVHAARNFTEHTHENVTDVNWMHSAQ